MENEITIETKLKNTVRALVGNNKGLLAMDESTGTCDKRFKALGIPQTIEIRRKYRELLITTPRLNESISGAILFDETIRQKKLDGTPFIKVLVDAGIIPGIKVDMGTEQMADSIKEKITKGLDGLPKRLAEYVEMGALFAKWRAVISIGNDIPSRACIKANADKLAQYAVVCQEAGLVPIVEPEVLMDGTHSLNQCLKVTEEVLDIVFEQLSKHGVFLEGMLLKPNMILPGLESKDQESVSSVSEATVKCLLKMVPAKVGGIAFLSGGQSAELASARLNMMNKTRQADLPWPLTFSFGRALHQPSLEKWLGKDENIAAAQRRLEHRAMCNRAASMGTYNSKLEQGFWHEEEKNK